MINKHINMIYNKLLMIVYIINNLCKIVILVNKYNILIKLNNISIF